MFNPDKYNFWPIYEVIKTYYPVGLDKEFNLYFDCPGYASLIKLIEENVHDDENYQLRWNDFCNRLEKEIDKEIVGTTYGQLPCFSAYVLLDKKISDDLVRTKELYFFVSLLGSFFSIIGRDGSQIEYGKDHSHWITNYVTVSPEKEYTEIFKILELRITERFQNYRLVPFEILKQKIEGLYTKWYTEKEMTIFNALFNNQINTESNISGNAMFGSDKWIREDYDPSIEGGWTIYPPQS